MLSRCNKPESRVTFAGTHHMMSYTFVIPKKKGEVVHPEREGLHRQVRVGANPAHPYWSERPKVCAGRGGEVPAGVREEGGVEAWFGALVVGVDAVLRGLLFALAERNAAL